MKDCIKCKDCKFFNTWRTSEGAEKHGQIYECSKLVLSSPSPDDYCSKAIKKELEAKLSTERLICNSCRKKYGCRHYGFAKEFIEENPNNDMKCEIYEKE